MILLARFPDWSGRFLEIMVQNELRAPLHFLEAIQSVWIRGAGCSCWTAEPIQVVRMRDSGHFIICNRFMPRPWTIYYCGFVKEISILANCSSSLVAATMEQGSLWWHNLLMRVLRMDVDDSKGSHRFLEALDEACWEQMIAKNLGAVAAVGVLGVQPVFFVLPSGLSSTTQ